MKGNERMMDPMALQLVVRLHRDNLLREAAADRLADEAVAARASSGTSRTARWRTLGATLGESIIQRFRMAARLESTSG
jgi:hypothetical protein